MNTLNTNFIIAVSGVINSMTPDEIGEVTDLFAKSRGEFGLQSFVEEIEMIKMENEQKEKELHKL